jgi:hypothetical protein
LPFSQFLAFFVAPVSEAEHTGDEEYDDDDGMGSGGEGSGSASGSGRFE